MPTVDFSSGEVSTLRPLARSPFLYCNTWHTLHRAYHSATQGPTALAYGSSTYSATYSPSRNPNASPRLLRYCTRLSCGQLLTQTRTIQPSQGPHRLSQLPALLCANISLP